MQTGLIALLGRLSKELREERDISPEQMAAALQRGGKGSASKVSRFESGKQHAEVDRTISVYADTMNLSLLDLLDEAEERLEEEGVTRRRKQSPEMRKARSAVRAARVGAALRDAPRGRPATGSQASGRRSTKGKKGQVG
jgi:transcriptional regulator with XRE-family HTH domain